MNATFEHLYTCWNNVRPGMNKLGGVARITDYKSSNDTILYSVRYILENKREFDIEAKYVSLYCD